MTGRPAERTGLGWYRLRTTAGRLYTLPRRPRAHNERPAGCIVYRSPRQTGRPKPKSQKFRPNFWKWQPPGRFLKRFPFASVRAEWGYYPKPPTI